jgi:hypothetical protein
LYKSADKFIRVSSDLCRVYLATLVAGLSVNVQLEILVLVEKAPTGFVDQEVVRVLLGDQVGIVAVGDRGSNLNYLSRHLGEKMFHSIELLI